MARNCAADVDLYENVDFCVGAASLPGMRPHFYFITKADILLFPAPQGDEATKLEDFAVIKDNITLVADKKWKRVDLVEGESEPSCDGQGSEGAKSFLNRVNMVVPGTKKKVTGLIAEMNNDDIVIAYPQRDGAIRIIGNEMFRVQLELGQNAGKSVTDAAQTTINASVTDIYPAPFYEGTLVTEDGTIDGKTDKIQSA